MAETKGRGGCSRDGKLRGMALRLHVFPSGEYPSVPFVLAFAVSKTDVPEMDGPETDAPETDVPETDVPETKEGGDGEKPRRMSPTQKVCCCSFSTLWKVLVDLTVRLSFSGVYGSSDVWVWLMLTVVCVGAWLGRCVYECVWRSAWQKEHVLSWDIVLIIQLYEVCL